MIHEVVMRVVDAAEVRRASRWRMAAITGLAVVFAGFAWALAMAPPFVGFLFAVGAAVGWCVWLEKCPEADTGVEPGPRGNPPSRRLSVRVRRDDLTVRTRGGFFGRR
jgi:hypothetical protein